MMKHLLNKYIGRIKQSIKNLTYRMDTSIQYVIVRSEGFPRILGDIVRGIAYFFHDIVRFLYEFPRIKAYKLTGEDWSVVYVGGDDEYHVIKNLIFQDQNVETELLSKTLMWRLPDQTLSWLEAGVNLVVCELSRLFPWSPTASYSFSGPDSVRQVIDIPDPLDNLLVGRYMEGNRKRIRKAERQGLSHRFTQTKSDLEFFHNEMYLPFIKNRHGKRADLSSFEDHKRWQKLGGVILVSQNGRSICGSIVTNSSEVCHSIEYGILHNNLALIKNGATSLAIWCSLQWAKEQGAAQFDFGGSHPWISDGIFQFKSSWGARVERYVLCSRPNRIFLSNNLPGSLRNRINQIGMISEIDQKYYCVYIPHVEKEIENEQIQQALKRGLEGIAVVQPGSVQLVTAEHVS